MNTPPVDSMAYQHFTWVVSSGSAWLNKLVSPLSAPFPSSAAVLELAKRVQYIIAAALVVVMTIVYRFISTRPSQTPPGPTPTPPPASALTPNSSTTAGGPVTGSKLSTGSNSSLEQEAAAIEAYFYEQLLGNVSLVRQQEGRAFKERITAFCAKYFDLHQTQAFKDVLFISHNFNFLYKARIALFMPGRFHIDDKGIIPVPSDGNCLFLSLATGYSLLERNLNGSEYFPDFNPLDPASLRKKITHWMKDNINTDAELCFYLIQAVLDYLPIYRRQIGDNVEKNETLEQGQRRLALLARVEADSDITATQAAYLENPLIGYGRFLILAARADIREALMAYIEKTSFDKEFGASPHIYGFSKILNISVLIERHYKFPGKEGAPPKEIFDKDSFPPFNPGAPRTITLLYNISGDHLDLQVKKH